jgi:uncharacterized protein with HEPN domain
VSRSDDKRLDDIRQMCAKAALVVARGRDNIQADEIVWLALERAIEMAGEAATQLTERLDPAIPMSHGGSSWECG